MSVNESPNVNLITCQIALLALARAKEAASKCAPGSCGVEKQMLLDAEQYVDKVCVAKKEGE